MDTADFIEDGDFEPGPADDDDENGAYEDDL